MTLPHLGVTRGVRRATHALHTPDTFVRAPLPGMEKATAVLHASPALGAGFTWYTAELQEGGHLGPVPASVERFFYVLDGIVSFTPNPTPRHLEAGDYALLPAGLKHSVSAGRAARLAVIEKPYVALPGVPGPQPFVGREGLVPGQPLGGDPDLVVRPLLPELPAFDFAVNTMTYQPGAALSQVEMHVMEHGLLMLEGGGIYRLDDRWYPVTAGDFLWMAPYCPQWFGAIGKSPARYLLYKDWNR